MASLPILTVSPADLWRLRTTQVTYWPDGALRFSTNRKGEVWTARTRGYSGLGDRHPVHDPLLDRLSELMRSSRKCWPEGGRFLVDNTGAYFRDENRVVHYFVWFANSRPIAWSEEVHGTD